MSRIHEALQRAYLERGKLPASGDVQVADPVEDISGIQEMPAPVSRATISFENIAQHSWSPSEASLPTLADRGSAVEQFRGLRSHVYQARYESSLKTLLIASGMPAEGKTFVSANLAISLARNSTQNILLIDADLRRPTLHSLLGTSNAPGLAEYLAGEAKLADIMQRERNDGKAGNGLQNLTFIPSGKCSDNSSELVANHRVEELIAAASPYFDWIVIDAPPVLAVTDAVELARSADAVMLIARAASTPYEVAQRTKAAFGTSRILGFVLNDIKRAPRTGSYNYNYYYSQEQENGAPDTQAKSTGSQG